MLSVISRATVEGTNRLRLSFADGHVGVISVDRLTRAGGVLTALDDPAFLARVTVGPGGRYLQWPGDIELCADALWRMSQEGMRDATRA